MKFKMCLISAASLLLCSCNESVEVKKNVLKVKCEEVKLVSQNGIVSSYPGKVSAMKDVNLSFRVAGVVEKINVKEGDYVRKDQIVAVMDSRDYKLQLDATKAEHAAIKGEVERVVALHKENSVTENDYEKAVNGLKQIESKLAAHNNAVEDTNLKAPFNGYIQKINFNKGEALSAGMPVISFISSSAPEIILNIPITEYLKRDKLTSATAVVNGFDNKIFTLERVATSHKANLNQLYETRFRVISNEEIYPSIGVSAMVTLNYESNEEVMVSVPFSAVVEREGESSVWILESGKATLKTVVIDEIKSDGTALISSGISEGEVIITAGVSTLKEGDIVEPLKSGSSSNIGNLL